MSYELIAILGTFGAGIVGFVAIFISMVRPVRVQAPRRPQVCVFRIT
jgi:hypothetical protein